MFSNTAKKGAILGAGLGLAAKKDEYMDLLRHTAGGAITGLVAGGALAGIGAGIKLANNYLKNKQKDQSQKLQGSQNIHSQHVRQK